MLHLSPDADTRTRLIAEHKGRGIHSVLHHIPLKSAPAGERFARAVESLTVTDDLSQWLLRLLLWLAVEEHQVRVIQAINAALA